MLRRHVVSLSLVVLMLVSATAIVLVAAPGRAATYPSPVYFFTGTQAAERSGTSIALVDLNQDGVADLAVGSPYNGSSSTGSVTFYVSKEVGGTVVPFATAVTTFGWPNSLFGQSMAVVGNFAGTGPTLVVGAPLAGPNGLVAAGNLTVFTSSASFSGQPSGWINSTHAGEELGFSLATAGDVNGDGFADLLAGAPLCAGGNGCVYVFFGGNPPAPSPAMTFTTASSGAHFGFSVAGNGSVDSNSALDIVVGAPDQSSSTGAVYVIRNLMGTGGSINRTTVVNGVAAGDHFGRAVALGDFNGDTFTDIAVGAPNAASGAGTVSILNGGSKFGGAVSMTLTGSAGESFGASVAAGDFHEDGFTDLLVGAPTSAVNTTGVGRAYAFYGGSTLAASPNLTLVPRSGDIAFGSSVAIGGDFTGDGGSDFAVGDAQFRTELLTDLGRAYVYAGSIVPTFSNPVILGWVCQPNTWDPIARKCMGIAGFAMTLQSSTVTKTTTTAANGSFTFTSVPGTYYINSTLFPYIDNSTLRTIEFNTVYTVLTFPLRTPHLYGIAQDAVNRTAFAGVTVALFNATGVLVNATLTPGSASRNYSVYVPPAFLPAVGTTLALTVKMWDRTHYLNTTAITIARNESVNASMFLNRFPLVSGIVRDISTTLPISGVSVQATQGAKILGTAVTNAQGAYTLIAVNASVPNPVFFNVTATRYVRAQASRVVDQNVSYPNQGFFLQSDTVAPTSAISPLLSAYTNTAIISVSATASDNYPNNVAQVALYYRYNDTGSFVLYATDTASPFTFNVNTTALSGDGRYSFYTLATDYGGNQQTKPTGNTSWTVVDTHAPGSKVAALATFEPVANFTVSATASDANPIAQVGLYYRKGTSGAYTLLAGDSTSPYRWSFNTTLLGTGDGLYQFYSLATDRSGNVEPVPTTADAQTTVDTTRPTLSITAPTASQVLGTGWVNVTWTASDATSGIATMDARLDAGPWMHAGVKLYHNFTLVPDGSHTVTVNITDLAGNSRTSTVSFTVSTVTPVVTIAAPASGAYAASSSVAVTWSVSNTGTGLASLQIRIDSGAWQNLATAATSYTFTSVPDGAHVATVAALGLNGAQATSSVSFTVDATPPTVAITAPTTNVWTNKTSIAVTFSATDATSGILRVNLSVDGGAAVNVTGMASYTTATLTDGTHTVTVTARDKAGHSTSVSVSVKVDTTPPSAQIGAPTAGASLTAGTVIVNWTASDAGSGLALTQVSVDNGTYQTVTGTSTTLTGLAAGSHTVTVRVTDAVGNVRSSSVTFTVSPSTGGQGAPLDPLVVAAAGIGVAAVIGIVAALLYLRRRKPKTPETVEPEELPKQGGGA